jgi:hypothetical protein
MDRRSDFDQALVLDIRPSTIINFLAAIAPIRW